MIEEDIHEELTGEATINSIIGNRMFLKKSIETQTEPYITYARNDKTRDMVSESNRFELLLFSKDMVQLETLATNIINFLENKKVLNGNSYFSISLENQTDGSDKLDDGFFWASLTFLFKDTT